MRRCQEDNSNDVVKNCLKSPDIVGFDKCLFLLEHGIHTLYELPLSQLARPCYVQ